jgi:hypothetical protein
MKVFFLSLFCMASSLAYAQDTSSTNMDDLFNGDAVVENNYAEHAFKSTRVIMGQSMEMLGAGVLDSRILHRFGTIKNGIEDLFGLDYASMRIGFDYGISKNLMIGVGRSTLNKELDGYVKYRLLHQHTGKSKMPISLLYVGGMNLITTNTIPTPTTNRIN